jgi:CRISPR-associated protein Cmr1
VNPLKDDNVITQVREYELITPLFGGGVVPMEADPVTLIRGTEIRGQLRFWWRACRSGHFDGNLAVMKEAENKLWGTASTRDEDAIFYGRTVQIVVESNAGNAKKPFDKSSNGKIRPDLNVAPAYAAFPLQPEEAQQRQPDLALKEVRSDVKFQLTIAFPADRQQEIEAALWAWETFGGIGARTRRGFGALRLLKIDNQPNVDLPNNHTEVRAWVTKKLGLYVEDGKTPDGLPHLSKNIQLESTPPTQSPMWAWKDLIERLRGFRQARTKGTAGRSLWPEADAIRAITGRGSLHGHPVKKFPRAAFGLPIIFHFKDNRSGDPQDTTLQGPVGEIERLASPLILRPFVCKNNQAVGLALILEGPRPIPRQLTLSEKGKNRSFPVEEQLTRDEAKEIYILNNETDVLKAFMKSLGGN